MPLANYRNALPHLAAPDLERNGYRLPDWCDSHETEHLCCSCGDGRWVRMAHDPGDGRVVRTNQSGHPALGVLVQCWCQVERARPTFDPKRHGVPQRLATATIASWGADNCRETIVARNYAVSWPPRIPWLVLLGQAGRGKTGLAVGIVREAYERHGVAGHMTTVERALARIRATFDEDSRIETTEYVEQLFINTPLLVLDDLGATRSSEWAEEKIIAVLNSRYESMAPTIVTANDENNAWQALHPRVRSRLMDVSTSVVQRFTGPDRRQTR